jgi:hypothetical protein
MNEDDHDTIKEFREVVNMPPKALEEWLDSDESKEVGYKEEDDKESVGHQSGRRIVKLLHTKQDEYTEADIVHMRRVIGYVHRHLAQRPDGDVKETRWRYSLMNWGHDPLK